jgi:hypothetical protein
LSFPRVEVGDEFFPGIFFALMITLRFVASFSRQVIIFSVEKGSDLQSASARRVSLTWVLQSVVHHGLDFSGFTRWVGFVILKKLWLVSMRVLLNRS